MSKAVENRIAELITGALDAAGYDFVRAQITGGGKYAALQIMAERKDGVGMTVEDCAGISRTVSELIEADAGLADRYDLEVSSPGIDRPLVKLQDYARFAGHVAKVELNAPIEGLRRFQEKIGGVEGEAITFDTDKGVLKVPFVGIERAKLVLTDALLKAAASGKMSH
ncbi:MAG: ribosome maturation factor RimP [Alphaproteobacteria bacterium]|nr:ribosome maturation factor RimP [Alphaproteobacteria bacterium]